MSTLTTGYKDCPIAPIRAETSHERVVDLLRAFLSCPANTTRAFDDAFGRAVGFYDVERGHLHYVSVSVARSLITELREAGPESGLGEDWAWEARPWRRFMAPQTRRELFGSPTLYRGQAPGSPWDSNEVVWEDRA